MVLKDVTMPNEAQDKPRYPGLLWPAAIAFVTLILAGITAGYLEGHNAQGGNGPPGLAVAGLVLLAGTVMMGLYLRRFGAFWQNWSRRKRLYMASLFGSALLGMVSAALIVGGQSDIAADPFFSNSALSPESAIALALIWAIGISIAVVVYQRTIDDHERHAYLWAGLAGYYAFVVPAPAWWVLARADLAPPVNAMLLFALTIVVNAGVYLWLKFR